MSVPGDDRGPAADTDGPPPGVAPAAMRAAMDRLARRDWARSELVAALVRSGIPVPEAEDAVGECVRRGWLDEETAARRRAARLGRRGAMAPAAIARDLERRRIDPAVAARVAEEAVPDPIAVAEAVVREAIARRGAGDDPADALPWPQRRRIVGRLARRGFDEDTIATAMRRAGVPVDDPPDAEAADRGGPVDLYD